MASPHVAGVAALIYDRLGGVRTGENGSRVIDALISTADDLYAPGYDPASGYGRVNALSAVLSIAPEGGVDPSPTPTPQVANTSVSFTEVPSSGQFTDSIEMSAVLTDAQGAPITDEMVSFQLLGRDGFRELAATTDGTGAAEVTLPLDAPPGAYELIVAYSGKADTYNSSQARSSFTIEREDSTVSLVKSGKDSKPTLTATIVDGDDATSPVAGIVVAFYANGEFISDRPTDSAGQAVWEVTKAPKKAVYEVRFIGNIFFLPASANPS
jgi:hypothetical protein